MCGKVRYDRTADPIFMGNCHCLDRPKATGTAYEAAIGIPAATLRVAGNVKYHDNKADSGKIISRGFCSECGSRLLGKASAMPDLAMITAGSLDDPKQYAPQMDIYTSSAQPWDHMHPAWPKFPKTPM